MIRHQARTESGSGFERGPTSARQTCCAGAARRSIETADVNEAARVVAEVLSAAARRSRVEIVLDLDPQLPLVAADIAQLELVLVNLAQNAIESMRQAGGDRRRMVLRTWCRGRQPVHVHVQDTGAGVAPGLHERVFEPFYSTKPGGLGMGLTISRSVIESYGGWLRALPDIAEGAVFEITLPHVVDDCAAGD